MLNVSCHLITASLDTKEYWVHKLCSFSQLREVVFDRTCTDPKMSSLGMSWLASDSVCFLQTTKLLTLLSVTRHLVTLAAHMSQIRYPRNVLLEHFLQSENKQHHYMKIMLEQKKFKKKKMFF